MSVVRVPSSRYRLDERDAYGQSLAAKLDYGLFVRQLGGLDNDDIEILLRVSPAVGRERPAFRKPA